MHIPIFTSRLRVYYQIQLILDETRVPISENVAHRFINTLPYNIILLCTYVSLPTYTVIVLSRPRSSLVVRQSDYTISSRRTPRSVRSSVAGRRLNVATLTNVNRFFIFFLFSPTCQTVAEARIGLVTLQGDAWVSCTWYSVLLGTRVILMTRVVD